MPTVTYKGLPLALTLDLIAFPTPDTVSFKYLGRDGEDVIRDVGGLGITLSACCTSEQELYVATCFVTVNHVTNSSVDVYRARFANAFGFEELSFNVRIHGKPRPSQVSFIPVLFLEHHADDERTFACGISAHEAMDQLKTVVPPQIANI